MKKFLGLYDKDEENALKDKIISFTDIPKKYVHFIEVHVSGGEYVHVTFIDDYSVKKQKKDLVLIHGLAGSSLNYFKIFKTFSQDYRIFGIDLPGMGCSSRHDFSHSTHQETEDYFIEKLKLCFDKLELKYFYLCGHSFGGYISSLFTLRHIDMVEKLILLSPVGLSAIYSEIKSTRMEDMLQSMSFKTQMSPSNIFKMLGGLVSNYIFNRVCTEEKFRGLKNKEEFLANKNLLHILFRNHSGSEKAIFAFFNKNLQAYKPITYFYEFLKNKPILILYGGDDWCPKGHAEDLQRLLPETVEIDIVSDSGHLIYTDNYKELAEKMLNYLNKNNFESRETIVTNTSQINNIEVNQSQMNNIENNNNNVIYDSHNDLTNKLETQNIENKNV